MTRLFLQVVPGALLAVLFLASPAAAAQFGFDNITNNDSEDAAIGETQLTVDVLETGDPNQVLFLFSNSGPDDSSIAGVYFDDGSLLGIAMITNDAGFVEFSEGASPMNLPGGNSIGFVTTAGFLADSDPPVQPLGVNPGETLAITFDLVGGQTVDHVIAELQAGTLRIGIKVQGYTSGGSESFVNVVPEPGAMLVFMAGLLTVELTRHSNARRRARA